MSSLPVRPDAASLRSGWTQPKVTTIPSSDVAFRSLVLQTIGSVSEANQLEVRLRRLFPRVVVRERDISGEPPGCYVYRDGTWRPPTEVPWWMPPDVPRVVVSLDGWLTEANPLALSLLGLGPRDIGATHFTDLIAAGTLQDALALFDIVRSGHDLDATIVLRPTTGDLIAVDIHATTVDLGIEAHLRLADDVELTAAPVQLAMPQLQCLPERDVAFRAYAHLALSRMPEPTPEGLALRLRRLYPHARVTAMEPSWLTSRDPEGSDDAAETWWNDAALARVVYDAQGLILAANEAATGLLGKSLVGHYWQEFVTPGSTEQVSAMLAILADVGAAESRFRMPGGDGSLVEFDSYTQVDGERYVTVIRPR
jgi:PAS domain-containing protein